MNRRVYDILLKDMCDRFPGRAFSQEEIADYVGWERERVSQIESEAKSALLENLRDYDEADIIAAIRSADGRRV